MVSVVVSSMSQERLPSLMIVSIEHKLAKKIDYEKLIDAFAAEKAITLTFDRLLISTFQNRSPIHDLQVYA